MAKIMEEQQKERERTELAVAKREKELLWDFCICAVLLVIITACVTAIVLPVM